MNRKHTTARKGGEEIAGRLLEEILDKRPIEGNPRPPAINGVEARVGAEYAGHTLEHLRHDPVIRIEEQQPVEASLAHPGIACGANPLLSLRHQPDARILRRKG